ncbi:MAG: replication initiator protein A [Candidatus Hydrogenedentes bacterium]|nr:replication initiator protein A [Candidatus Hydrogenedentota bacterium]
MNIDEKTLEHEAPPRSLTKDELNIAELPVSLSCNRAPKGRTSIHLTEEMLNKEGRLIRREWTVSGSSRYGLPLAIDDEVLLGLAYFLREADFEQRQVHFTQYSLFRLLGWGDSQRSYDRLEASLRRLKGVHLESKESFWNHKDHCFLNRGFGLIDNYVLYRKANKPLSDQPFISSVTFNETIFESFRSGFVKTLDLGLFLSLRYPIARKLFRLLDKKLHKSTVYEIELMRLANRIALTDSAYPSDVKKHLRAPHEELVRVGFLKQVSFIRKGRSETLRYVMNPRSQWHRPATRIGPPAEHPLVRELTSRGITRDVASSLLTHGEKEVADKLEVFDYLRESNE